MREVSAHAQNNDRSVAAEIFSVGTYFPNTPRILKQFWSGCYVITAYGLYFLLQLYLGIALLNSKLINTNN
jgi:hypothetical protein